MLAPGAAAQASAVAAAVVTAVAAAAVAAAVSEAEGDNFLCSGCCCCDGGGAGHTDSGGVAGVKEEEIRGLKGCVSLQQQHTCITGHVVGLNSPKINATFKDKFGTHSLFITYQSVGELTTHLIGVSLGPLAVGGVTSGDGGGGCGGLGGMPTGRGCCCC